MSDILIQVSFALLSSGLIFEYLPVVLCDSKSNIFGQPKPAFWINQRRL